MATAVKEKQEWTVMGYTWRLHCRFICLYNLEKTYGSLEALSAQLIAHNMGTGMPIETQAVLVWAAQLGAVKKITPQRVRKWFARMGDQGRLLLVNWASALLIQGFLESAAAQLKKSHPPETDEDEDEWEVRA